MHASRKLVLGLVVAILFLLILEGGLRLTVSAEQLKFSWESSDPALVIEDHGGLLIPSNHTDEQFDGSRRWRLETNRIGLRESDEIPYEKPPGLYRMLALGDSWMFGWSADQEWTLPTQLEVLLTAQLDTEGVEVINAAVFGSAAFDILRRWRQYKDVFEVDAVLLGMPHNLPRQQTLREQRTGWYDAVRSAPFVDVRLYLVLRRLLAPYTRPQYPRQAEASADAMITSIHDITMLVEEVNERGLDVWFVAMPTWMSEPLIARQHMAARWMDALEPLGVRFAGHLMTERSCWGDDDLHHPSPAGYRAIAEVVAQAMVSGQSATELSATPSCDDVPGYGPGKP